MVDRKRTHGGRGPEGPLPSHDHSTQGEAPQDPSRAEVDAVDPELVSDLGAEFPLRGDQVADELETARAEAVEWQDKALRAQADFANTRKRLEAAHADALLRAGERIVENLLPVLDDLDRAIDHSVADGSDLSDGLVAVRRKLLDVLAREGCSAVDPFGEEFDPDKHNAVQMREDVEVADHTVVEVFQKGYEMHGRVLRPAMVVVSTGGPSRE
jgi:molecular chaperone GrpE